MSIEAVQQVFALKDIPSVTKHVLTVLAFRANDRYECWPTVISLSNDTGLCERSVMRSISWLIEHKLLERTVKGGVKSKSSHYKLTLNNQVTVSQVIGQSGDCQSGDTESGDCESGDTESGNQVTVSQVIGQLGDCESGNQVTDSHVERNMKDIKEERKEKDKIDADASIDRAPDLQNAEPETQRQEPETGKRRDVGEILTNPSPSKEGKEKQRKGYSEDFEKFWTVYPRKVAKQKAWEAWNKTKDLPPVDYLIACINILAKTDQWQDPRYIPHATTWINQRRWEDEECQPKQEPKQNFGIFENEMLTLMYLREDQLSPDPTIRQQATELVEELEADLRARGCPFV